MMIEIASGLTLMRGVEQSVRVVGKRRWSGGAAYKEYGLHSLPFWVLKCAKIGLKSSCRVGMVLKGRKLLWSVFSLRKHLVPSVA
jgi:hypothetical protein